MIGSPTHSTRHTARPHPVLRRWAGAVACTATVLAAGVCALPTVAGAAPATGCAKVTAVLVPGTGETNADADPTQPDSGTMLAPVAQALKAHYGPDMAVDTVPYAASLAPTYATSESEGDQALSSLLSTLCPTTHVVLVGYSQGSQVAGDLATRIGAGQGPIPASRVTAVGLIADPRRDSTTPQLGQPVGGEGVEGPRSQDFGQLADRVCTVCAQGDLYCSASPTTDPVVTSIGRAFTGTIATSPALGSDGYSGQPSQPSAASSAIGGLDGLNVSTVTQQVLNVLAGMTSLAGNLPAIGADLAALPPRLVALDVNGAHQLIGDLNNQFRPLVTMASQVDLHLIARILTIVAPADTSGVTAAAAQIVGILAGVDITRVATDLGTTQETAWTALQKLTTGDIVGAGAALTGLIPVALDLAAVAANALTGTTATPLTALTTATSSGTPGTGLADLARQGTDAAQFFASGVHQSGYTTDLHDLTTWLTDQIG